MASLAVRYTLKSHTVLLSMKFHLVLCWSTNDGKEIITIEFLLCTLKDTAIISLELSQFPYIYGPITISVVTCKSRLKNSKWFLGNSKQPKIQETQVVHLFSFTGYKVTSSWFHFCSQFQFLLDFSSTLNLFQDFWGLRELESWAWTFLTPVSITYILDSSLRATRYNIFYK